MDNLNACSWIIAAESSLCRIAEFWNIFAEIINSHQKGIKHQPYQTYFMVMDCPCHSIILIGSTIRHIRITPDIKESSNRKAHPMQTKKWPWTFARDPFKPRLVNNPDHLLSQCCQAAFETADGATTTNCHRRTFFKFPRSRITIKPL